MTASLERQGLRNSHLNTDRTGGQGDPQVSSKFKTSLGFYFKIERKRKANGQHMLVISEKAEGGGSKFKASLNEWCFQGTPDRVLRKII